ncbi:hypothetical protein ARMGADRAFT_1034472 [Armillaria gallica]|uniref:Uncharacterized protein n=1 Tax=Armillaria gallica TaxID=47427 RepID=A0A2H3D289_ARMGA|nr:hypothetical protein ARMGADRAFT_1034472 [Armillaria gallica]
MSSTEMPDERWSDSVSHLYKNHANTFIIKIKLVAGGNVQKSSILKVKSNPALNAPAIVTWIIAVGDLGNSMKIEFKVYSCRSFHLPRKLLIGCTESKNMSDLVKGAPIISIYNNVQSEICTLNAYRISIKEAVGAGINATNEPRTLSEGAGEVLQILQVAGPILDKLSETYKKQAETKGHVIELCMTMKMIHQEANSERASQKQEDLTKIYNSKVDEIHR